MTPTVAVALWIASGALADAGVSPPSSSSPVAACASPELVPTADGRQQKPKAPGPLRSVCEANQCTNECKSNEDARDHETARFRGSFLCPGKSEVLMGLFPCGGGGHGTQGPNAKVVVARATLTGWLKGDTLTGCSVDPEARSVRLPSGRDALYWQSGWGPYQGISGEAVCAIHFDGKNGLTCDCPISFEEQHGDGCPQGADSVSGIELSRRDEKGPAASFSLRVNYTVHGQDKTDTVRLELTDDGFKPDVEGAGLLKMLSALGCGAHE